MRIWAKIIEKDTIVAKDTVYETNRALTYGNLEEMLREICYTLDLPTPVSS